MSLLTAVIILLLGCGMLAWGADRFAVGASAIARNVGVSSLVIGIVLVGFATSLPEMLVSTIAALHGAPLMAIGNAIGSNITNIALVIGFAALLKPIEVHSRLVRREFPLLLGVMVIVLVLLLDRHWGYFEGVILSVLFVLLMGWMYYLARSDKVRKDPFVADMVAEVPTEEMSNRAAGVWWMIGLITLLISSRMIVVSAITIAMHFGVSDLVIGLTIVALGTSLPELAAAIACNLKNEPDMVLGNIIGSNLFNLIVVMLMPALIAPTNVPDKMINVDMTVMFVVTLLLIAFAMPKLTGKAIGRVKGVIFLICYIMFIALQFLCS